MLTALSIRNIVLIEETELTFASGLCVLTGETGAGKSILLDSLGLVLGMRAEARLVRHGAVQASVTARFDITNAPKAQAALEALGLEAGSELILRRSLTPDGKTRCFINDETVSVAGLKSVGATLIEINGQHDGRGLLDAGTHRDMADAYGELAKPVLATARAYALWKERLAALEAEEQEVANAAREKEYLEHMQAELARLAPEEGEEAALATARTQMMQGEKLASTLKDALSELNGGKGATMMAVGAQKVLARSALGSDGRFDKAIEALERASVELDEATSQIEKLMAATQFNPHELERSEERLFALRAAARKHHVAPEQLSGLLADVNGKLARLKNSERQVGALTREVAVAKEAYAATGEILSAGRVKAARKLQNAVLGELDSLRMGSTQFEVDIQRLPEERWGAGGLDAVQFQAATNKGSAVAPLHRIASGGELSRFMLAMKVALAQVKSTPTLIFDEIDTGTGGAVADAIGKRLAVLGLTHQVLVVTHLPQVAARGASHLRVMKEEIKGMTMTRVENLAPVQRREELARMLAGAEVTAEARKAAEKLLQAV